MKEIERGKDKLKEICDAIKSQTIDPAKQKANEIIENAKLEASDIKHKAEKERTALLNLTEKEIQQKQSLCLSSIKSASKQVIDQLKQEIENEFFSTNLHDLVTKALSTPDIIAQLINALVKAIEKEGISLDLSAFIPREADPKKISALLAKEVLEKLKEKQVVPAEFSGGAKIKLHDKQITIDMSDEGLTSLLARYIRKEFREMIFTD